ncbi:hypothetical protein [Gardnerella swidsinskii]|uniref:hypothetical protein n=1 Tax=Gardnerella swidsinskii TaxID=2792979 RepID=UPI003D187D2E
MARVNTAHHLWVDMTDEEMLRSCGLILEDPETNKEGITLAAVLLFGTDNRIMSVLPQHKTDVIFRVFNVDRYDDRDVVITNLIESYDKKKAIFFSNYVDKRFSYEFHNSTAYCFRRMNMLEGHTKLVTLC